ncbi:MAG: hypothetical protein KGI80_00750 [Verrucomicrobiota bacterium]|nr:hypothetical protein [Verrucomicrobiota bacterium]
MIQHTAPSSHVERNTPLPATPDDRAVASGLSRIARIALSIFPCCASREVPHERHLMQRIYPLPLEIGEARHYFLCNDPMLQLASIPIVYCAMRHPPKQMNLRGNPVSVAYNPTELHDAIRPLFWERLSRETKCAIAYLHCHTESLSEEEKDRQLLSFEEEWIAPLFTRQESDEALINRYYALFICSDGERHYPLMSGILDLYIKRHSFKEIPSAKNALAFRQAFICLLIQRQLPSQGVRNRGDISSADCQRTLDRIWADESDAFRRAVSRSLTTS